MRIDIRQNNHTLLYYHERVFGALHVPGESSVFFYKSYFHCMEGIEPIFKWTVRWH